MEKVVSEFLRLLKEKPESSVKVFFLDYVSLHGLNEEEQAEVVELWQDRPQLAEEILLKLTNVFARDKNSKLCAATLLKFVEFWKNGSIGAGAFLQKYSERRPLQDSVQLKLVELWQEGSADAGNFLLKYRDQYDLCNEVQQMFVDALPNSIAIKVLKEQSSYSKEILFKLLDAWKQYPDEVSIILEDPSCQKEMLAEEDVMLKLLDFMEERPEAVKKIMQAYMQSDSFLTLDTSKIPLKLLDHMEKGSAQAKELMVLCAQRIYLDDEDLCERTMKLFKANRADIYEVLMEIVKHRHADTVDRELINVWQAGSQAAYILLSNVKRFDLDANAKLIKLWQQDVSGAYTLLKAQGKDLVLGEEDQAKLAELIDKGSEEAYNLLSASVYYPGNRLHPAALIKLLSSENQKAKLLIRKKMKQLEK